MKNLISKHRFGLALIIPGIIGGFLYWKYVGCATGTCPITANWHMMVAFGGLIGYVVGDSIDDQIKKRKKKNDDNNDK